MNAKRDELTNKRTRIRSTTMPLVIEKGAKDSSEFPSFRE